MKRAFLLLVALFMLLGVQGQTIHRTEELRSLNVGNIKLYRTDSVYVMSMRSGNSLQPYFPVVLGKRERAEQLLEFIMTLKLRGEDMVDLENETHNIIKRAPFGGFWVFSEGRQFQQGLTKQQARKLLKAVREDTE